MFDTLVNRVRKLSLTQPDKLAIAFKKEKLTYNELYEKTVLVASRLRALGVHKGDAVLFSALSKPEMIVIYLAIHYVGAVAVFIDKNSTAENAAVIYNEMSAVIFLTDKSMKNVEGEYNVYSLKKICSEKEQDEQVNQVEYQMPAPEAVAELIFTSGTTGKPKGVTLSYRAVYNILVNTSEGLGLTSDDCLLLPLPLNHSLALRELRANLYNGATIILQNGFTFAKEIENNLDLYKCSLIVLVPASIETIRRQMQGSFVEIFSKFRLIEVGAGSLSVDQRKTLSAELPNVKLVNTWGSSECGGAIFLDVHEVVNDKKKVQALGKPLPSVQLAIRNENGEHFISDKDHPGRMAVKGDMVMSGYWNMPKETDEMLSGGWLLTNDMVYLEDGYAYMLGRADDIINVGGEKVSPIEVENIISEYPNMLECAVIGVPDPEGVLGFVPALYLVMRNSNFDEADLKMWLSKRMEKYKIPVIYIPLLELPRNAMKKIDRKALRAMWENAGENSLMNPVIQNLLTRRSVRKFTDEVIPKDVLNMILQAGYYAPSGHNMQTWRFYVITQKETINQIKEVTKKAALANKVHFYGFENPNCLVLITNDSRNINGAQDASCAAENIMLAAWSYGIGSVWLNPLLTLRKEEPAKSLLDKMGVPENHIVYSMVALGYPAAEGSLLAKNKDVVVWVD